MYAIIQARMSSQRLPGKMLRPLHGSPLLDWVISRVRQAAVVKDILVATSDQPDDDEIANLVQQSGVQCFRGSLEDVRSRFIEIARAKRLTAFVRISGDSPMIDPSLIDQAVTLYHSGNYDLVTNVQRRTFPKGQSVEVLRSDTLLEVASLRSNQADQEHVTRYYYENPSKFRILNFQSDIDYGGVQLSVDTHEDFIRMEQLMVRCDPQTTSWMELVEIVKQIEAEQT